MITFNQMTFFSMKYIIKKRFNTKEQFSDNLINKDLVNTDFWEKNYKL